MSGFYPVKGFEVSALQNSLLVVPSVSLANLPQLTADLLITSLDLKRVGWIGKGDTVIPFAGLDGDVLVTGGMEVYGKHGLNIYVVQQRSPTLKIRKEAHVTLLRDFLSSVNPSFVLILTSINASEQDDAQLLTSHQHILPPSPPMSPYISKLLSLPRLQLHLIDPIQSTNGTSTYPPFLPSAGLTRRMLVALRETSVPHGAIAAWCAEGDNRGDAVEFTRTVLKFLGENVELKEPLSWAGLFGSTEGWSGGWGMDAEIYG
ncbi:hypothetical protein M231_05999 [Tremella mesenterica]|uniref:Proteasome assembly chaperone 2 n=1 Tax=Tremella mesenterica TaxID=5217 RepID=A0A4Q1BGR3_TREME|nr:hypothetical protein M231_05999 [Tremella mesenterica]